MNFGQEPILKRVISICKFEKLCSLWEKLFTMQGSTGILLTNSMIALEIENLSTVLDLKTFYLFLSPGLSILLQGVLNTSSLSYQVTITSEANCITNFVHKLYIHLDNTSVWKEQFIPYLNIDNIQITDLQSYLNSNLEDILGSKSTDNFYAICQELPATSPLKKDIKSQLRQEKLLTQVIGKIRQTLDLPTILETAVKELGQLLKVDRLIIYEFNS